MYLTIYIFAKWHWRKVLDLLGFLIPIYSPQFLELGWWKSWNAFTAVCQNSTFVSWLAVSMVALRPSRNTNTDGTTDYSVARFGWNISGFSLIFSYHLRRHMPRTPPSDWGWLLITSIFPYYTRSPLPLSSVPPFLNATSARCDPVSRNHPISTRAFKNLASSPLPLQPLFSTGGTHTLRGTARAIQRHKYAHDIMKISTCTFMCEGYPRTYFHPLGGGGGGVQWL